MNYIAPASHHPARSIETVWLLMACLALAACDRGGSSTEQSARTQQRVQVVTAYPRAATTNPASPPLVRAARRQVGVTVRYDPAYVQFAYPGGDVPRDRGVCTDVVVRALRTQGIDLQREIHQGRIAHPAAYAAHGLPVAADANIDHRRVPNQMTWFARQGWARAINQAPAGYLPGDIVAWRLANGLLHIGIVSDRQSAGISLVLHNIGSGTQEEDRLLRYTIIGHYRPVLSTPLATRH